MTVNNVLTGLLVAAIAGVGGWFLVAWHRTRKQHCWVCGQMDRAEDDPQLAAELDYQFYLWEIMPAAEPHRERS